MTDALTLAFLGDVMLGRGVNDELPRRAPEAFWGSVLPRLRGADAVVANLECAITPHARRFQDAPKAFYFRADPQAIAVLQAGHVRAVSLANNHAVDFEIAGLLDTLALLDAAGIAHAGAGWDLAAARAPAVFEVAGRRIALIAMTDNEPAFAAGPARPGTNYLPIAPEPACPECLDVLDAAVSAARRAGAAIVILSCHWGPNMVTEPPAGFRAFARAAIDRGVDVFHGHSAHLFQGVERHGRGLILYDTGDALDDYAVDPALRNDWSFLFVARWEGARLAALELLPLRLRFARVDLAEGDEFQAIRDRMRMRCAPFGTPLVDTPDGLLLRLDTPAIARG